MTPETLAENVKRLRGWLSESDESMQTINHLVQLVGEMRLAMHAMKDGSDGLSLTAIGAYRNVMPKAAPIAALAKEGGGMKIHCIWCYKPITKFIWFCKQCGKAQG